MAKKKDEVLNREMGDGASGSMKGDESHDVGKEGYHKSEFGGNQADNYRIADGYAKKDESPSRSEGSKAQEICHHSVTGELYSGDPEAYGHKGKVAAAYKSGMGGLSSPKEHAGGGKADNEA